MFLPDNESGEGWGRYKPGLHDQRYAKTAVPFPTICKRLKQVTKFIIGHGLANLGNSCYMNCILQVLSHLPYFFSRLQQIITDYSDVKTESTVVQGTTPDTHSSESTTLTPETKLMMKAKLNNEGLSLSTSLFSLLSEILNESTNQSIVNPESFKH